MRAIDKKASRESDMEDAHKLAVEKAQKKFHAAVASELQKLQDNGVKRSVAVLILLERIAGNFTNPDQAEVDKVVSKFGLAAEDATRALIVKNELIRLKQEGRDGLAAVEELTRKMMQAGANAAVKPETQTAEVRGTRTRSQTKEAKQSVRKRALGDDSMSAVLLKRLRRIAMKDGSKVETQEKGIRSSSSGTSDKKMADTQSATTPSTSPTFKKRNILKASPQHGNTGSSKRLKKSKQ